MGGAISGWRDRRRQRAAARRMAAIVLAAARRPELYLKGWAEDTFDGRRALFNLHGALLLRRLRTVGSGAGSLAERFGEALSDTIEVAYREDGVGDTSIARKVRTAVSELYGLASVLDAALDGNDRDLVRAVLVRNGLGGADADGLAGHVMADERALAELESARISEGHFVWPDLRA